MGVSSKYKIFSRIQVIVLFIFLVKIKLKNFCICLCLSDAAAPFERLVFCKYSLIYDVQGLFLECPPRAGPQARLNAKVVEVVPN